MIERFIRRGLVAGAALLLAVALGAPARAADADGDGLSDAIEEQLGTPPNVKQEFVTALKSPNKGYDADAAARNAPDVLSVDVCHVGDRRVLYRVVFAHEPVYERAVMVLYVDIDEDSKTGRQDGGAAIQGTDVMIGIVGARVTITPRNTKYREAKIAAATDGAVLYLCLEAEPVVKGGKVVQSLYYLSQLQGGAGASDRADRARVSFPYFADRKAPPRKMSNTANVKPPADYRYREHGVNLRSLSDKGLKGSEVAPVEPFDHSRPRPRPTFETAPRRPGQRGSVEREIVPIEIADDAGVAREGAWVKFGFPMPRGACFDPARVRALGPDKKEIPCQVTATAFWPDDSLKWVLIDFQTPLGANEKKTCFVEFGATVERRAADSKLSTTEEGGVLYVVTGPLKAAIGKRRFNLLAGVWLDANGDGRFDDAELVGSVAPEGIRLVDETGGFFGTAGAAPRRFDIEEQGPRRLVVRVEGDYATSDGKPYMSYVTRLTFREGSPVVTIAHTHVDTYLETEFTDVRSLELFFRTPEAAFDKAVVALPEKANPARTLAVPLSVDRPMRLFQMDDKTVSLTPGPGAFDWRTPGLVSLEGPGGRVGVIAHEFWQRWPKDVQAAPNGFAVGLLPRQPDKDFGKGLPHWLFYPFTSGHYRFKWGMAFTSRVSLDFGASLPPRALRAEADLPVVAVVPAEWYNRTGAFEALAAPRGKQFAAWDQWANEGLALHLARKERDREYGYMNVGDWFGERTRNWGNNEYDTAHGFLTQFARSGDRRFFRWGLATARHQADADMIHAYPDRRWVGCNHAHAVAHTGEVSHEPEFNGWSAAYGQGVWAGNGHTWCAGMIDAWLMTGDPWPMEASLALGEHVAQVMAPNFKTVGTHERTAGWALVAIVSLYRATYDPAYLDAANKIAAVALREQKLDLGGAWPHKLPHQHAAGQYNQLGSNVFLTGILFAGLKDLHEETADPKIEKSLRAAGQWIFSAWDDSNNCWPYSATPEGKAVTGPSKSMNPCIYESMAFMGNLTGEARYIEVAERALGATVRDTPPDFGKMLSFSMVFTQSTMGLLQQWHDKQAPEEGRDLLVDRESILRRQIQRVGDAEGHRVRAPDQKTFYATVKGRRGAVIAERRVYGSKNRDWPKGTIHVFDPTGHVVKQGEYDTNDNYELRIELAPETVDGAYRIQISDDQRAVWSLRPAPGDDGKNVRIVAETNDAFSIGGVGQARYYFFVPEDAAEFKAVVAGVHPGAYGGAIRGPDGKVVEIVQSSNTGPAQLSWAPNTGHAYKKGYKPVETLTVRPAPGDRGKVWSVCLWAAGDVRIHFIGAPPYLATKKELFFLPQKK